MAEIRVLDSGTIDKIAAGEVVERPASVVKELVENALDAGAGGVTVEIRDGGISFIRVTDNGSGIEAGQVRNAFLRHATSKIESEKDLHTIKSLGFRGEALSSICAVAKVELITKTRDSLTGVRYVCEGAQEKEFSEVGAPDGTTILVRSLFFNTPVRRKFLKQPQTEGSYIVDLMEHLALSRPDVSFKLSVNGQVRFHTLGNGDLKEVIYRIYGKECAENLVEVQGDADGVRLEGYLGKPVLNRSNRNFENCFINGRYIKSSLLCRAVEDGYGKYLMQHRFPFAVLHFAVDAALVDVNVHPTKMDVRFTDGAGMFELVSALVQKALAEREMIPEASLGEERPGWTDGRKRDLTAPEKVSVPEPFEQVRTDKFRVMEEMKYEAVKPKMQDFVQNSVWKRAFEEESVENAEKNALKQEEAPAQMNLFEEKILDAENRESYRILGQIFDTYWLVAFRDRLLIIDQHAAHEKVKYERLVRQYREKSPVSQTLNPPIVATLTAREAQTFEEYRDVFAKLGFEVEEFGGNDYAVRSVPADLYGCGEKELFLEVLDGLSEGAAIRDPAAVGEKLASMACKAAVKGNMRLSTAEAGALLDELLTLENPYNCPHGRPTVISVSQYELEKKFKRIV